MVLSLFELIFVIFSLWISIISRSNYFMIVTCLSSFISSSNKTSFPSLLPFFLPSFLLTFRPFVLPPYFASLFPTFFPSFFPSFLPSTRLSNLFHPSILFYFLPSFFPSFLSSFLLFFLLSIAHLTIISPKFYYLSRITRTWSRLSSSCLRNGNWLYGWESAGVWLLLRWGKEETNRFEVGRKRI